jgi:Bacterial Ig-like domain (group 3)
VTSNRNPSIANRPVTFTATVLPAKATGTVQFFDGATLIGTATLSSGSATLTTSSLSTGTHPITARYGGDVNDNGSTSAVLTQTVSRKK